MKILHLRRHSIKDGLNGTIGLKGIRLDSRLGYESSEPFAKIFHGPSIRTSQTALAFTYGLSCRPRVPTINFVPKSMPIIFGLGDDTFFSEIGTDKFKKAVKGGLSKFAAIRKVHGQEKAMGWAKRGHLALMTMFDAMEDNEKGVGFFHSPTIELTAWVCKATESGIAKWSRLGDMEGLVFALDTQRREIRIVGRIDVETKVHK